VSVRFLLDVGVVVEPLRARPDAGILRRLRLHDREAAVPAVAWIELRRMWARLSPSWEREVLAAYLDDVVGRCFPVVEFDRAAAEWLGEHGPLGDGVTVALEIAAIAATRDLTVATGAPERFARVQGVRVADWRRPSWAEPPSHADFEAAPVRG